MGYLQPILHFLIILFCIRGYIYSQVQLLYVTRLTRRDTRNKKRTESKKMADVKYVKMVARQIVALIEQGEFYKATHLMSMARDMGIAGRVEKEAKKIAAKAAAA